jgi:hypothetical protein
MSKLRCETVRLRGDQTDLPMRTDRKHAAVQTSNCTKLFATHASGDTLKTTLAGRIVYMFLDHLRFLASNP